MIDLVEHTGLMEVKKNPNLQPAPNDLSRWIAESQWAALDALCTHVPVFGSFSKEMDKNSDDWEKYCSHERPEDIKMPGDWGKVGYPRYRRFYSVFQSLIQCAIRTCNGVPRALTETVPRLSIHSCRWLQHGRVKLSAASASC